MISMITQVGLLEQILLLEQMEWKFWEKKEEENLEGIKDATGNLYTKANEPENPQRRNLLIKGGKIAAGIAVGGTVLGKAAEAVARGTWETPVGTVAKGPGGISDGTKKLREYKEPSAIREASDIERKAWKDWHVFSNDNGAIIVLNKNSNLKTTSPIYHLLRTKMKRGHTETELNKILFHQNPGLFYFALGTIELYKKNNKKARSHYATGMMISANLGSKKYKLIKNQGISFEQTNNEHETAYNLGQAFIRAPIKQKLFIDRIIGDNIQQSSKTELFWNLGFFPHAEFRITKKSQKYIYETQIYQKLFEKFNYHSLSNSLKKN